MLGHPRQAGHERAHLGRLRVGHAHEGRARQGVRQRALRAGLAPGALHCMGQWRGGSARGHSMRVGTPGWRAPPARAPTLRPCTPRLCTLPRCGCPGSVVAQLCSARSAPSQWLVAGKRLGGAPLASPIACIACCWPHHVALEAKLARNYSFKYGLSVRERAHLCSSCLHAPQPSSNAQMQSARASRHTQQHAQMHASPLNAQSKMMKGQNQVAR